MRRSRVAPLLLVLALPLAACSDEDPSSGLSSSSPSTDQSVTPEESAPEDPAPDAGVTIASRPCGLLSAEEVIDLLGEPVGQGITQVAAEGVLTCTFGDLPGLGLQVGAVAASDWAESLPTIAERARPAFADDPEALERIDRAARLVESGTGLDDIEACEVFRTIAIANGGPRASEIFVNLFPDAADADYMTAQACRDGVFGTLVVSRPGLADTPSQVQPLVDSLDTVLVRALEG